MRYRALITALALLAAVSGALPAQAPDTSRLAEGARVRVEAPALFAGRRVGSVAAMRGDTLLLRVRDRAVAVPLARVERIEVRRGDRRRGAGALRGMGIGLLSGIAVGLAYARIDETSEPCGDGPCGIGYFIYPILGGGAGLALGGVLGAAAGWQRWERVPLPARVGLAPRRGGLAASASPNF